MLGSQPEQIRTLGKTVEFFLNKRLILGKLAAQRCADGDDALCIGNDLYASEHYHTAHQKCPVARDWLARLGHTIADLVARNQRFCAVAAGSSTGVEIQATVIGIIVMIDGSGIGVAIIPINAENASLLFTQNFDAILFCQLLALSNHFSKHMYRPFLVFLQYTTNCSKPSSVIDRIFQVCYNISIIIKGRYHHAIQKTR